MLLGLFWFSHRELIPNPTVDRDFWGYSLFSCSHMVCYKDVLPELSVSNIVERKSYT